MPFTDSCDREWAAGPMQLLCEALGEFQVLKGGQSLELIISLTGGGG